MLRKSPNFESYITVAIAHVETRINKSREKNVENSLIAMMENTGTS